MENKNHLPSSNFKWPELLINVLLLFFQILSIHSILNGTYVCIYVFIFLSFIQYKTLKLFKKFIFNEETLIIESFILKEKETFDYDSIKEVDYVKSNRRDGPFLLFKFKSRKLSFGYQCYFKEKSNYVRILSFLKYKGVSIVIKGFEPQEQTNIKKEMSNIIF